MQKNPKENEVKRSFILLIILSFIVITYKKTNEQYSISQKQNEGINRSRNDKNVINEININHIPDLFVSLSKADYKFMPKKIYKSDGRIQYRYFKINPNNLDLDTQELESRIENFNLLFSQEKKEIIKLIRKLNEIGVLVIVGDIKNLQGISGYWKPIYKSIVLDNSIIRKGTYFLHDVLAHEAIHVAQSCAAGSLTSNPKRIGLPLDFSNKMNQDLSHEFYIKNSQEGLYIEQEAYSHSKDIGTAFNLLTQLCS